jgi:hypothetical protein
VDDEQPDHSDGAPASGGVVVEVVDVEGEDNGYDDVAGRHADGPNCKHRSAANSVNCEVVKLRTGDYW